MPIAERRVPIIATSELDSASDRAPSRSHEMMDWEIGRAPNGREPMVIGLDGHG